MKRSDFANPEVKRVDPSAGFIAFINGVPYEALGRTEDEAKLNYMAVQELDHHPVKYADIETLPYDILSHVQGGYFEHWAEIRRKQKKEQEESLLFRIFNWRKK